MYLKIIAFPDSRKEFIEKREGDTYAIWVRQPAERGEANKKILDILKSLYPDQRVRIVNGHQGPRKLVEIL